MKKLNLFLIIVAAMVLSTCNEDDRYSREFPLLRTYDVEDITPLGATFHAEIIHAGKQPVINHGFVWGERSQPTVEISEKWVKTGEPAAGQFDLKVETTLKENIIYYVRSFVNTKEYIVYGDQISFLSLGSGGPEIRDFRPKSGTIGDTVFVVGNRFSSKKETNKVFFDEQEALVVASNDSLVTVIVPSGLDEDEVTLAVSILGNKTQSTSDFILTSPELKSFMPEMAGIDDTLTITGKGFSYSSENNIVLFGDAPGRVVTASKNAIKVIVPPGLDGASKLTLRIAHKEDVLQKPFQFLAPEISGIEPGSGTYDDTLTIVGNHFSPIPQNNMVKIGIGTAKVVAATKSNIEVIVPRSIYGKSTFVELHLAGRVIMAPAEFQINPPIILNFYPQTVKAGDTLTIEGRNFHPDPDYNYIRLDDVIPKGISATATEIKVLAPYDLNGGFYPINVVSNGQSVRSDTPLEMKNPWQNPIKNSFSGYTNGFVVRGVTHNDRAYILNGNGSWFWYDKVNLIWNRMARLYYKFNRVEIMFSIGDNIYIGGGEQDTSLGRQPSKAFFRYEVNTDTWIGLPELPEAVTTGGKSFSYNSKGYYISGAGEVWQFNPSGNAWSKIGDTPLPERKGMPVGFLINGKYYIGGGFLTGQSYMAKDFYEYDIEKNAWARLNDLPASRYLHTFFAIENKGYVGVYGFSQSNNRFWEYDPVNDSWHRISDFLMGDLEISFSIGDEGFAGTVIFVRKMTTLE